MEYRNALSKYNWITNPPWAILLTIAGFLLTILISMVFSQFIPDDAGLLRNIGKLATILGVPFVALFIVYGLRKYGNQSFRGLHLHVTWDALPEIITGIILTLPIILLASMTSIAFGVAEWKNWSGDFSVMTSIHSLFYSLIVILFTQGFPEELFFRGHLFDTLSHKMSTSMVILLTSLAFGSLHFFSQSPAEGFGERLMFAVYAIGFGFVLAASRITTGSLWFPIGFHVGTDGFSEHFITFGDGSNVGMHLLITTIFMVITGFIFMNRKRPFNKP